MNYNYKKPKIKKKKIKINFFDLGDLLAGCQAGCGGCASWQYMNCQSSCSGSKPVYVRCYNR